MRIRNITTITAAIISLLIVSGSMIEGLGKFPKAINMTSPTHKPTHDAFSHTRINKLMTNAQAAIDTPVIVDLNVPFTPEGQLSSDQIQAQRAAIAQARLTF